MSAATVKHLDPTQVELEISIEQAELEAARERAFRDVSKNVKIRGFRPGKVPRRIFEAQYGTGAIEERAMDAIVPEAYSKAMRDNDLDPVDQPRLERLPDQDGAPVRLKATVAVRPQIELGEYKGLELQGPSIDVTDAEVETAIEGVRKERATLVPVERPVALGDVPTIDYAGTIDGVAFDGGTAKGQPTEILADRFIPGFADGIVGMSAGESKDVHAQFPADYGNAELAGKAAVFAITVLENKVAELAELDDEFAQALMGPEASVGSMRDELRNRIEANKRAQQRRAMTPQLVEKLLGLQEVALPAVLVERETANIEAESKQFVERAGMTWEQYLVDQGKPEAGLQDEYRKEGARRVKTTLLLEAIAKAENVVPTQADLEGEIAQLSRQYQQPRENIIEMLRPNFDALVDGITRTKTLDFIMDHAKVTVTDVPPAPAGDAPAGDAAASAATAETGGGASETDADAEEASAEPAPVDATALPQEALEGTGAAEPPADEADASKAE